MNKRKDGKISIVLDTKEAVKLLKKDKYAEERGYYLDEMLDYDEKQFNWNFFTRLDRIL